MKYYNDMVSKFHAVHALVGGGITGEGDNFTYHDGQTPPTKEQIDAKQKEMQVPVTRASEYPDIGDQLDDLYHAGVFSADMIAKLKKVKDDNPKPE